MSVTGIIAAAGSGERFGAGFPKAFIQLGDRTLIEYAVASLAPVVDQIVIRLQCLSTYNEIPSTHRGFASKNLKNIII